MRTIKVEISVSVPEDYQFDDTLIEWAQVADLLHDMNDRYYNVNYVDGKIISDTKEP